MSSAWTVELLDRQVVGPGVIAFTLAAPAGFNAHPGQFVLVGAGDLGGRHYTVSSPDARDSFELTVDVAAESPVVQWLADRGPGDTITIEGPFGTTYYDGGDDVVAIGGGPGIGAAVAVAERALQSGHAATVIGAEALIHEDRLAALAASGAPVFSVRDALEAALEEARDGGDVFMYGFDDFVERVREAAGAVGIGAERLRVESYGPR